MKFSRISAAYVLLCGALLAPTAQAIEPDACAAVPHIAEAVSRLRELPLAAPIPCREVSKEEMGEVIAALSSANVRQETLRAEGVLYKLIGLIPESYDYEGCLSRGTNSAVYALYDYSKSHAIYVTAEAASRPDIVAHEIVHALQDRRFDLARLHRRYARSSDGLAALASLIEGDAMDIEDAFVKQEGIRRVEETAAANKDACALPPLLSAAFDFPYGFGHIFADRLRKAGGNRALDAAFRVPPQSTREILHAKDYDPFKPARKGAVALQLPERLPGAPEANLHFADSLGQYGIRLIMTPLGNDGRAVLAGKGWEADSAGLYRERATGREALYWRTRWQNEAEAVEFAEALNTVLSLGSGEPLVATAGALRLEWQGGTLEVVRRGPEVSMRRVPPAT